jgi:small conductance mechanosensitive channel
MDDILRRLLPGDWHDFIPALQHGLRIVVVLAGMWIAFVVLRRSLEAAIARERLDRTAASFIGAVVRYAILAIVTIAILAEVGIDTTSLLGSVGILGLTLGFAARDALSNVISGLFILWDRPFVIGDLIEIDGSYGRVDRITMRSTRVVTPDGRMLAIPNSTVVNTTVASYTNFPHLRLDVPVTVGVDEDLARVREILLGLCREEGFSEEPPPRVVVTALNDYNVELQLQAWIDDETAHIPLRFALREGMFEALRGADVHLPYETLELAPIKLETSSASSLTAVRTD